MAEFLAGQASGSRDVVITFDDGGRSVMECGLPVLAEFSAPATMFVIAGFVGCRGRSMEFLTWDDIDELTAADVDIGSHGLSHQPLVGSEADAVRRELYGAAELFERRGVTTRTFAYPYGRRSDVAKEVVREAGFEAGFMIKAGGTDAFELRRRLCTLAESGPMLRFFLSDHYFGVRGTIVSAIPDRYRRDRRPLPDDSIGPSAFGLDGWEPPPLSWPPGGAS
jgi:peptidoglycan/xylan/chitin deacetylase (PgdA/CDA1 family)